jgi:hypothetical protein
VTSPLLLLALMTEGACMHVWNTLCSMLNRPKYSAATAQSSNSALTQQSPTVAPPLQVRVTVAAGEREEKGEGGVLSEEAQAAIRSLELFAELACDGRRPGGAQHAAELVPKHDRHPFRLHRQNHRQ